MDLSKTVFKKSTPVKNNNMKDFIMRPKNNFLHTASWEEIYALTEHWLKELEFFKEEISFLDTLVGKYYILLAEKESIDHIQQLSRSVSDLIKEQNVLSEKTKKHLKDLGLLMENAFSNTGEWFRSEHTKLEDDLTGFTKQFRKIKQEIFEATEQVLKSQKLHHLLTA
jgi:hypothetical protein